MCIVLRHSATTTGAESCVSDPEIDISSSGQAANVIEEDLSLCVKPTTEPSNGCRAGRFGFYVWHEGVLRAAIWVLRQECDYIPHDTPIDEEMENEDAYAGESE